MTQRVANRRRFVLAVLLAVLLTLAGCSPLGWYWLAAPKERIHVIVPAGYEGQVLIAYRVPDGVIPEKKDDAWQFHLQDDGALLLQVDPLPGIGQLQFFYERHDGTRQPIPPSSCFDDDTDLGTVVCTGGSFEIYNARAMRPNESYYVGHLDNYRQRTSEEFDELYDRYFDRLALPEPTPTPLPPDHSSGPGWAFVPTTAASA